MTAALLDAVDEGTPVTGIADFDSLSSTYGLMGIYRKGRGSSGFYGHRFRLTFPPVADVAAVAGAYWTLPYINSVEPEPVMTPILKKAKKKREKEADTRIGKKLAAGVLGGVGGGLVGAGIAVLEYEYQSNAGDDGIGSFFTPFFGFWGGNLVGTAVGVSAVDPQDNFLITLAGGALLGIGVPYGVIFMFADVNNETASGIFGAISGLSAFLGPIVGATLASELWRKPPQDSQNSRVSLSLGPTPNGGLSAVAQLRF